MPGVMFPLLKTKMSNIGKMNSKSMVQGFAYIAQFKCRIASALVAGDCF